MMQTVQLCLDDSVYMTSLREALAHSCAWHVESLDGPVPSANAVLVLDEISFARLALPLWNPERVVLITRRDPALLAEAWEAGIVSIISPDDAMSTVLLAIMAAGLRVARPHEAALSSAISPNVSSVPGPIAPQNRSFGPKRCKMQ